jgi:AcrR family transcriptional regulator
MTGNDLRLGGGVTSAEIIDAAFRAWGRDLYLDTSLSQVARELGVSKPALYRHFRNKQALLDAMTVHFFDDFTAFVRADYEKALHEEPETGIFTLIRVIARYFAQNVHAFIFSLVKLYDRCTSSVDMGEELRARGVDFGKNYAADPLLMRLIFTTLTFFMAIFHKRGKTLTNPPSPEAMAKQIDLIIEITERGLGYSSSEIGAIDFAALEGRVSGTISGVEGDPLLRAVAGAVAEAGPWEASMEQVARRSGLSKSSLYGHFTSKHDMLRQLFMTEFERITDFARQGMGQSTDTLERLYLGIFSIAEYLRAKPDILVAMDWVRTRRLDFVKEDKRAFKQIDNAAWQDGLPPGFHRLLEDIVITPFRSGERFDDERSRRWISHWILFLIINILVRPGEEETIKNEDIRLLYKFLTLGIGGCHE